MSERPEQAQAIGEFLAWVAAERGGHLMAWKEHEQFEETCPHFSQSSANICRRCAGTHRYTVTVHYERWLPIPDSLPTLLAEWASSQREQQSGGAR